MELVAQLRQVAFQTGAFLAAWSWALVYYGISHVLDGESPLEKQIGFGGQGQPQKLSVLFGQYFVVCGFVWGLLVQLKRSSAPVAFALSTSLEFLPSPIFSAALSTYLSQYSGGLQLGVLNLAATWIVAATVSVVPSSGSVKNLGDIVRRTVGFGLGVAWNSLASEFEPLSAYIVARTVYLTLMLLLAASLAVPDLEETTLRQRHASLLSFASMVVCAFALSDWLSVVMPVGIIGNIYSMVVLMLLAAICSEMVLRADLSGQIERSSNATTSKKSEFSKLLSCLILVPCVWCCCPCIPLLWLLSGVQVSEAGVKNRWLRLTSVVVSLAASVVGTNILTNALDAAAVLLRVCDASGTCNGPEFLLCSVLVACVVSSCLLVAITPLVEREEISTDGQLPLIDSA
mmetsp:Transcript_56537/g.89785  ORF Transcript_56537/g.89785 Transcript_56537/m.89785 type:complete len:402 (-) Transcript_56537:174-1379(-)